MAPVHGWNTRILVDAYDLSMYLNDAAPSNTVESSDTTGFAVQDKTFVVGARDAMVKMAGFFDGGVHAVDEILQAALGTADKPLMMVLGGWAVGNVAKFGQADETSYQIDSKAKDAVKISADAKVDGGLAQGLVLHPLQAETASGNSSGADFGATSAAIAITSSSVANPTHITSPAHGLTTGDEIIISFHAGSTPSINGTMYAVTVLDVDHFTIPVNVTVGGANGTFTRYSTQASAAAQIHVTAFVGTTMTVKVQHSVDNVTFVDLFTFTAITAVGSQRMTQGAGVVHRYLRESRTATITSATFAVAAARR